MSKQHTGSIKNALREASKKGSLLETRVCTIDIRLSYSTEDKKIYFSVTDNLGGLDWRGLLFTAIQGGYISLQGDIQTPSDAVQTLRTISLGNIQDLVFVDGLSVSGGTGRGLSFCKELAEMASGHLQVGEMGNNTSFAGSIQIH